ncbi:hypothetical protein D3C84_992570 [compost metagenome]
MLYQRWIVGLKLSLADERREALSREALEDLFWEILSATDQQPFWSLFLGTFFAAPHSLLEGPERAAS